MKTLENKALMRICRKDLTVPEERRLVMLLQFDKDLLGDVLERFEDAHAGNRATLEPGHIAGIQKIVHIVQGSNVREIALVVLDRAGELVEFIALLCKVDPQVIKALNIGLHPFDLAVRNKDNAVNAFQNELSACGIEDLAGYRIEMKTYFEALDISQGKGKEVEEKCPLRLGSERNELSLLFRVRLFVDILQIGCLAAESRAIIDDLAVYLTGRIVNKGHLVSAPT
jgi:hypothetical protein